MWQKAVRGAAAPQESLHLWKPAPPPPCPSSLHAPAHMGLCSCPRALLVFCPTIGISFQTLVNQLQQKPCMAASVNLQAVFVQDSLLLVSPLLLILGPRIPSLPTKCWRGSLDMCQAPSLLTECSLSCKVELLGWGSPHLCLPFSRRVAIIVQYLQPFHFLNAIVLCILLNISTV